MPTRKKQRPCVVYFKDGKYATLDFTPPDQSSLEDQAQHGLLPHGWIVAPAELDIIKNVVANHPWGTEMLVLADGTGYGTNLSGTPREVISSNHFTKVGSDGAVEFRVNPDFFGRILIAEMGIVALDCALGIGKHLWDTRCFADCTVSCGDREIKCHKAVLAVSPVFKRMFETGMREGLEGKVEITNCEPDVVDVFIQAIYLGQAHIKSRHLLSLMTLADRYGFEELCLQCAAKAVDCIHSETAVDVVKRLRVFADRPSFEPIFQRLRQALIQDHTLLDLIIKTS